MPWDVTQYEQYRQERLAPALDLLELVNKRPGIRAVDLGCGTGEITAMLAEALGCASVAGVDSSPEMIQKALPREKAGLSFRLQRIEKVAGQWDLVFSNASLQWLGDHPTLLPKLVGMLRPGGQFVTQIPRGHPAMGVMHELGSHEPYRSVLQGAARPGHLPLLEYAELLHRCGLTKIVAVEKIYGHLLADADAILEWVKGTAMVPYLERLGDLREPFVEEYRCELRRRWPERPVFFGFQRMLLAGTLPQ